MARNGPVGKKLASWQEIRLSGGPVGKKVASSIQRGIAFTHSSPAFFDCAFLSVDSPVRTFEFALCGCSFNGFEWGFHPIQNTSVVSNV